MRISVFENTHHQHVAIFKIIHWLHEHKGGGGSAAAKASSNSLLTGMTNRLPDSFSRCHWSSCFDIFLALVPEQEVIAVLNQLNATHEPMSESALKSYKLEQQTHIERLQLRLPLESNATS
jgi:hypothetical protein